MRVKLSHPNRIRKIAGREALWKMRTCGNPRKNVADFTRGAWKKLRKKRSAFSTFSPALTAANLHHF